MEANSKIEIILREMFNADWIYGAGFYAQCDWRYAYDQLFELRFGVKRKELDSDARTIEEAIKKHQAGE